MKEKQETQKQETQEEEFLATELDSPAPRPGELLRAAREAKKLSTADVAAKLRLRKQLIEEIEENKFDPKVAGTFTRGYLRAYAKLVELPEEEVLAAYYELGLEAPRKDAMQSFSRRTKQQTADSRLMIITYVIAAVIIASVVLFAWQQANHQEDITSNIPERSIEIDPAVAFSDAAIEEDVIPEPVSASTDEAENTVTSASPTGGAATQQSTQNTTQGAVQSGGQQTQPSQPERSPAQSATTVTRTQTAPEQTPTNQQVTPTNAGNTEAVSRSVANASIDDVDPTAGDLVFYFRGDCWVRIDDATGENIAGGVKQTGYIMPLTGEAPYSIQLGAPDLVEMWYRGERVDMSQFRQGRVARFTWPVSE